MFKQKIWLFLLLLSHVSVVIANDDTGHCPRVDEIKRDEFNSWLPLYKDNYELASDQDVEKFKKNVVNFKIATWSTRYSESAHCFYQGNDPIVGKILFAQRTWRPIMSSHWFWHTPEYLAECRTPNPEDCRFIL